MDEFKVDARENAYFALKAACSVLFVWLLVMGIGAFMNNLSVSTLSTALVFVFYALFFVLFLFFQKVILIGYLKGSGIRVSSRQFPEVFARYEEMCGRLNLGKAPALYLLQSGGALNAFATRFSGRNYIAIYSEVFSLLDSDTDALDFVIGHELAHVKRNHASKVFWTWPSALVPFLATAYSRRCEYTCDNFAYTLTRKISINGLVLLAAGKELYRKIDIDEYVATATEDNSAVVRFAGILMSHPFLPKRIKNLQTK